MDFGLLLGDSPTSVPAAKQFDTILRQAHAAQRNGIKYLLIGQHFLFPGARWLQPVPLLARVAAEVDADTRLASFIMISPLYHPVMLAEELATLDIVSEGRLCVGLGLGYIEKEFQSFGIPFAERASRFEEGVQLLKRLWTEQRVTHQGEHYRLDEVDVHIHPLQQPHPPLWIGAQSLAGVRRAARVGDACLITGLVPASEIPGRVKVFADERARVSLPLGPQPLRRDIVVGRDREHALDVAAQMSRPWFEQMAGVGANEIDPDEAGSRIREQVSRNFILGSADECAEQLRAIGERAPIGPILVRGNWPGMEASEIEAYLDSLGAELIPAMRDYHPSSVVVGDDGDGHG